MGEYFSMKGPNEYTKLWSFCDIKERFRDSFEERAVNTQTGFKAKDEDYPVENFIKDAMELNDIANELNASSDKYFYTIDIQPWSKIILIGKFYKEYKDSIICSFYQIVP